MRTATEHQIGQILPGGYRVIKVLQGGMGVVYICHQEATEQLYAIKTVRFDGPAEEIAGRLEKFREEANRWIQISRDSRSDNIVRALAFDADDQLLILEFIDGLALGDLCFRGTLHPGHALRWARQIAEGMREIHGRFRLLHRDLKPSNVLVTRRGLVAKITDFGIVKAVRPDEVGGTISGTPGYMAPECFQGRVDYRSDVYSFGATLLSMLTGQRNPRLPESLDALLEGRHAKAQRLVKRCVDPRPEKRFQSFDEIVRELSRLEPSQLALENGADGDFRLCGVHQFSVPSALPDAPCPFCAQERDLEERLLGGKLVVRAPAEATLTLSEAVDRGREPSRAPSRRRHAGVRAAAVLAVAAVALLAVLELVATGRGKDGEKLKANDPGPGAVKTARAEGPVGSPCQIPGCRNALADASGVTEYRKRHSGATDWTPIYCPEHSPYSCRECTRREPRKPTSDDTCASCGLQSTYGLVAAVAPAPAPPPAGADSSK